jgi:hypothetical protein
VKPKNYNFWTGSFEAVNDNELPSIDLNRNTDPVNVSKISNLDIIILFKYSLSHPEDKFALYDNMAKRVNELCSGSYGNERILFANDSILIIKPEGECSSFTPYLDKIEGQYSVDDMKLIKDYGSILTKNNIVTKRRNINIHVIYLYKDMVFSTFQQSTQFLQMNNTNVELISKLEKNVFGNQFNTINVNVWSNFTPAEMNLLNRFKSINQNNWKYQIY